MPTKKPRLTVTFDPDTYQAIKSFSAVQDRSMGAVINELLTETTPALRRVTSFLTRAKGMNGSLVESIAGDLESAAADMEALESNVDSIIDSISARSKSA